MNIIRLSRLSLLLIVALAVTSCTRLDPTQNLVPVGFEIPQEVTKVQIEWEEGAISRTTAIIENMEKVNMELSASIARFRVTVHYQGGDTRTYNLVVNEFYSTLYNISGTEILSRGKTIQIPSPR